MAGMQLGRSRSKVSLVAITILIYRYLLDGFSKPGLGSTALSKLTAPAIRSWYAHLVREAPNSISPKAYRLLHAILATATDDGLIPTNPCRIRGASSERAPERPSLSVGQVSDLARAIEPRWRSLVLLAAYGGLRFGELIGLRRRDIDLLHDHRREPVGRIGQRATSSDRAEVGSRPTPSCSSTIRNERTGDAPRALRGRWT